MKTKVLRKIIQIDEAKCNGCGDCIDSCAEGALALVDGKARLVKDQYCDGLAACLKECPQGALSIIEREAEEFDEAAAMRHVEVQQKAKIKQACACPGLAERQLERHPARHVESAAAQPSTLTHWPVQLALVPPGAKFLRDSDVILTAHCVPVAYPDFHRDFLAGHSILIACPKLDDTEAHLEKLTEILRVSDIRSLTVLRMEVPCCSGLTRLARLALSESGQPVPFQEVVIGINGEKKSPQ
ncbi:MAG TPA: 4Fe-4S dicluster domain-containing protein [Dehalococcoidales bacterium]|nr:4Fe-4S dicluster domain-containing protein [Dehalococcoidales bacterium]